VIQSKWFIGKNKIKITNKQNLLIWEALPLPQKPKSNELKLVDPFWDLEWR
jgi:hypothetical protein